MASNGDDHGVKREREETSQVGPAEPPHQSHTPAEKKQRIVPTEGALEVRGLVSNKESGIIIGKGGANISKIRDDSFTFINILKNDFPSSPERVVKIKGDVHGVTQALQLITSLLGQERPHKDAEAMDQPGVKIGEKSQFKLLIHKQQAGAIIGKGGEVIKQMQEQTGCRIQLSNDVLDNSTDKSVTLSGSLESVHLAIQAIIPKLEESAIKPGMPVIPYMPGKAAAPQQDASAGAYGQQQAYGAYGGYPGYGAGGYGAQAAAYSPYGQAVTAYGYGQQAYGGYPAAYGQPVVASGGVGGGDASGYKGGGGYKGTRGAGAPEGSTPYNIPTTSAGAVIGKGGSVISHIKAQSGTQITISDPDPKNPNERTVNISGTTQGVETAIYLIKQRVDQPTTGGAAIGGATSFPGGEATEKMSIPSSSAGSVIGKGGSVISDIKSQSGCHIRISDPDAASMERVVTISGSPQGIQTAIFMIRQRVDAGSSGAPLPTAPSYIAQGTYGATTTTAAAPAYGAAAATSYPAAYGAGAAYGQQSGYAAAYGQTAATGYPSQPY
eukprot:gb/GEZN01005649.1/.p1 GENE.gb/GEZN01005649.1/~~gb/GEZN01005649.1/.p1  ORF type:complete len:553 (-),score=82.33 gb/GEZN01005649.1/:77-1735(-)